MSSDPLQTSNSTGTNDAPTQPGETQVIGIIWLTYGSFYFCRNNLAVALPSIEADLGYSKSDMALVLLSLKVAYGLGQFINGQLSERFSARRMLALGMLGTAALNVVFGFGTALNFLVFAWACNGFAQSLGWTPCVRVIGNWIPVQRRGKAIGIVGTGYMLTGALTYVVAGIGVWLMGWRGALWLPPMILVAAAIAMLVFLRDVPGDVASATGTDASRLPNDSPPDRQTGGILRNLKLTLSNPALWLLALSLGMLNACRYGFVDWGVSHLVAIEKAKVQVLQIEVALSAGTLSPQDRGRLQQLASSDLLSENAQKGLGQAVEDGILPEIAEGTSRASILRSAVKYAILPFGAIFGSFLAGWATDRFFASRRAPVICGLLLCLGCLSLVYDQMARTSFLGTMILLWFVGFTVYGPQVLLVGTAPADLAREGTSAAAAGFVNFMGYAGAAMLGDLLTGMLIENYGWQTAIYAWAGWAFGAAITVAFLWNAKAAPAREQTVT